jgi:hypothetical protein
MQRAIRHEAPPPQDYPSAVHPLQRYATPQARPEPDYHPAPPFAEADHEADPSRYDDALYGQLDSGAQDQHDPAYPDDPYTYQDEFGDNAEEPPVKKRGGGMMTVVVVLALAVLGTGAAFAYRTYVGSPRSGDVPVIKADTSPIKIMPVPADGAGKVPDRMAANDGTEKIVPREEAPVDVNAKAGPRVVLQPMNPVAPSPAGAGMAPAAPPPAAAANGTAPVNEPRKIKTFTVPPDQANAAVAPVAPAPAPAPVPPPAKPAPVARAPAVSRSPSAANASANAPLSLSPQAAQTVPLAEPRTRVAAISPAAEAAPSGGGGGYLVQVSSQKNEADAKASFRTLQGKFPGVLGSRAPLIKRADLGEKGIYYRAMVGPFGSPDEASQFCGSLKTAGGQCVVQRN